MTPVLDGYRLVTPGSLREVLEELSTQAAARPFAGGTDLMVLLESGALPPGHYVSLSNCPELRGIEDTGDVIAIGALTTYTEILRSDLIRREFGMLATAASETGSVATQNRGTIGGNIANASPAADTPPALLAYDATLELLSSSGSRQVPYADFHRGYRRMDLGPDELIARIHLPRRASGWRDYYRKVGTRRAQATSKVCFAGAIRMDGTTIADVRIALGSVAPTVIRARGTEAALRNRPVTAESIASAERSLASEIAPIDDLRSTARYRTRVACNLMRAFLS